MLSSRRTYYYIFNKIAVRRLRMQHRTSTVLMNVDGPPLQRANLGASTIGILHIFENFRIAFQDTLIENIIGRWPWRQLPSPFSLSCVSMFSSCSVAAAKEARADSSSTAILAEYTHTRRLSDGFQPSVLINREGGGLLVSKISRETPHKNLGLLC